MGFIVSQCVYAVTALGVPDLLADGARPAEELADAAGAHPDRLYRVLRLLAANGIFVEHDGRRFSNNDASELLRSDFREFALVFGEEFYPAFGATLHAVRSGESAFDAVFGTTYVDYLAARPDASARFNRFMAGGKDALADALAARFRGGETVVDVGGGNGALLEALLARRPELHGVLFDLPHVVEEARERLGERCEIVAGDFFAGVPDGADVYVLSRIVHGMQDEQARELLASIRRAIRGDGRVLFVEEVVAPPNEPGGKFLDLVMLAVGGRERTEDEWRALLATAGFELHAVDGTVLEAVPV